MELEEGRVVCDLILRSIDHCGRIKGKTTKPNRQCNHRGEAQNRFKKHPSYHEWHRNILSSYKLHLPAIKVRVSRLRPS